MAEANHINDASDSDEEFSRAFNHVSGASNFSSNRGVNSDEDDACELHSQKESASLPASNKLPLIPSDCDDVQEAHENFLRVFEARYGDKHPFFTPIGLPEAIQDLQKTHYSMRKPILMYLHDDNSLMSHLFCTQVLCAPAMIEFVNSNFVLWAWDFTVAENRTKVIDWIENALGHQYSLRLRVCTHDDFPVLLVLGKTTGSVDILALIKGAYLLEQVMMELVTTLDLCNDQIKVETAEEAERLCRERVRMEQEHAFNESLEADMRKTQLKVEEEKRKDDERQKQAALAREKEEERKLIETRLAPEPDENSSSQSYTTVKIRTTNGANLERRFLLSQTLSHLFDFVTYKHFSISDYKLLTNFPKRDLTALDPTKTFKDLQFGRREVINMEAR